mmetsp:Transcript_96470/g.241941  ORF Transcript_96470/g.241941 Transcript_96470/m.241941 type:complete len:251 (+) Transcript_96470:58-810(+)
MTRAGRHRWFPWICNCEEASEQSDSSPHNANVLRGPRANEMSPSMGSDAAALASPTRRRPVLGGSRTRHVERVLVHVYDLGDSFLTRGLWNSVAKNYGAFHTGVEVYGREYLFGVAMSGEDGLPIQDATGITGISWHTPRDNCDHSYRETLSMGFTTLSQDEVFALVEEMKFDWTSSSYNVLTRNCHDFTNEMCLRLGVAGLPAWVNSLAPTGASTYEYFENTDSGYDGGESLYELFGSVRNGLYRGLGW